MKVRLPGRDEVLTLVVSRLAGQDKPMMLLASQGFAEEKLRVKPLSLSQIIIASSMAFWYHGVRVCRGVSVKCKWEIPVRKGCPFRGAIT